MCYRDGSSVLSLSLEIEHSVMTVKCHRALKVCLFRVLINFVPLFPVSMSVVLSRKKFPEIVLKRAEE